MVVSIMKYVISNQPHNEGKAKADCKLKLYLNNKCKAKGSHNLYLLQF